MHDSRATMKPLVASSADRPSEPVATAPGDVIEGMAPIARADARVLILGSMPGVRSLGEQRYYAHPANAFWHLIGAVLERETPVAYPARKRLLIEHRIALWDVVCRCRRAGSLDAAIDPRSVEVNDIAGFLRRHRSVRAVVLNGGAAATLFRRHLQADVERMHGHIRIHPLPSSSPANASWSRQRKTEAWLLIRQLLRDAAS